MMENIRSHEGEEGNNTTLTNYTFKPPKNIKQIGENTSQKKIYVEDYVFTYIREFTQKEYTGCKVAVLLGKCMKIQDIKTIIISGAVEVKGADIDADTTISNEAWTSIYDNIKKYFNDVEVVGWYIGGPGFLLENEEKIRKIHIDNFAGIDKVLLRYDSLEGEEGFYLYEHGQLNKMPGYYIYYEKNDDMQAYIMEHKKNQGKSSKELEEQLVKEYKEEVKEQKQDENKKSVMRLMYATGTLMAVIVIVIAATIINNNGKIKELESALNDISQTVYVAKDGEDKKKALEHDSETTMNVETVSGKINDSKETVIGDYTKDMKKNHQEGSSKASSKQVTENIENDQENVSNMKKEQKQDVKKVEEEELKKTSKKEVKDEGDQGKKKSANLKKNKSKKKDSTKKNDKRGKETSKTSTGKTKYYTVEEGDTLASICIKLYHSTENVDKIIRLNGIEDQDKIFYGQKLIVP